MAQETVGRLDKSKFWEGEIMKCNCMEQIETAMKEQGFEDANIVDTGFITSEEKMVLVTVSTATYKDGQTKSGKDRIKKMPVKHSYCPFCGTKYE